MNRTETGQKTHRGIRRAGASGKKGCVNNAETEQKNERAAPKPGKKHTRIAPKSSRKHLEIAPGKVPIDKLDKGPTKTAIRNIF